MDLDYKKISKENHLKIVSIQKEEEKEMTTKEETVYKNNETNNLSEESTNNIRNDRRDELSSEYNNESNKSKTNKKINGLEKSGSKETCSVSSGKKELSGDRKENVLDINENWDEKCINLMDSELSREKTKELGRNLPIREKQKQEEQKEIQRFKERIPKEKQRYIECNREKEKSEEKIKSESSSVNNEKKDLTSERHKSQEIKREGEKTDQKQELEKEEKWHEISSKHTGEGNFKNSEISKDFFIKVKNSSHGYHCKDINLLKKIYEIQKSYPKTELYLKNQDCKNVPSRQTLQRLVEKSFKSKSEYNTWRSSIRLREIQEIAKSKGGECLSSEYKGCKSKLKFQCKREHEFEATPTNVKNNDSWCATCEEKKKLTLKEFQDIAKERGGKCLSTKYINIQTKLRFQCKKGHEFEATPNDVKHLDSWCPICLERAGERICRGFFEAIFNKDFKKARPEWLKNCEGHQLELDGYNDELKLAFELNGKQHYEWPNYFHKTVKRYITQMSNDQEKGELCETNGVTLIEIPYWIEYDEMQKYIIKLCKDKGIDVPQIRYKIDWKKYKWGTDDDSNRSLKEWI